MNLKTHTGYPEINIAEDFSWTARIIGLSGKILEEFTGDATSRADASTKAHEQLVKVMDNYKRPEDVETVVISADDVGQIENLGGE